MIRSVVRSVFCSVVWSVFRSVVRSVIRSVIWSVFRSMIRSGPIKALSTPACDLWCFPFEQNFRTENWSIPGRFPENQRIVKFWNKNHSNENSGMKIPFKNFWDCMVVRLSRNYRKYCFIRQGRCLDIHTRIFGRMKSASSLTFISCPLACM